MERRRRSYKIRRADGHEEHDELDEEHLEGFKDDPLDEGARGERSYEWWKSVGSLFHTCTFLEDGFLIGFGLEKGVEIVENDHNENHPFKPTEALFSLTKPPMAGPEGKSQHGKVSTEKSARKTIETNTDCRTKGWPEKRRYEVEGID